MRVATAMGHTVVRMGDFIWAEVDARGLPRNSANVGMVANAVRKKEGKDAWAIRTANHVKSLGVDTVMIDGIRSNYEVQVFRQELGDAFLLLAIHTEPDARYHRLTSRARDDDPMEEDAHRARDQRELDWGLARTIALADHMIVNDGSLEAFLEKVQDFLHKHA